MNNIIAFIPARSGSKSIVDKNIKELGGKPLLSWTIETAFKSGLSRVIVSSDSEEYLKIAREWGAEVMLRPQELAQDETSMFQVLKSEIPKIEPIPEIVCLLQPTSPFREVTHIKMAISLFCAHLDEYDSLISVEKVPEKFNPAQIIISTPLGSRMASGAPISQRITRRQDFPEAFIPTGSLYFFKTSNFEKGSIYGEKQLLYETEGTYNLNTMDDWKKAADYLKKQNAKNEH